MRKMIRRPTHPGNIIKEDYLLPLSITIKDMADTLGVSRKTLSKIINERGAITPDMALRLSRAFDTTPDFWLNLQKKRLRGPGTSVPFLADSSKSAFSLLHR
jgi:addiction module HigA family antidote